MMRVNKSSWPQQLLILLLLATVAFLMITPIAFYAGLPSNLDFADHIVAIIQGKLALAEGQFPLRVMSKHLDGWHYPYFQFYSPTSYTITSLIYRWIFPANPFTAYKFMLWCAELLGGIYMYRLIQWLVKSKSIAILTSVFYMTSPYYIVVINYLGAFNEAIALGVMPAVVYYSLRRYYHATAGDYFLQTGLVWYLLATIHLLTFMYSSLFVGLFLLLITINTRQWKRLIETGVAYVFACVLAIWYLAPIVIFSKFFAYNADKSTLLDGLLRYRPSLANLLAPLLTKTRGIYTDSSEVIDSITQWHPNVGIFTLAAVGVCFYAVFKKQRTGNQRSDVMLFPLLILFVVVFVFVWMPVNFWAYLPQSMCVLQYSWRLLGQVMWIGALLFAWAISWLFSGTLRGKHLVLGLMCIAFFTLLGLSLTNATWMVVGNIKGNPVLPWNTFAYLIDPKKHPEMVDRIDNMSLSVLTKKEGKNILFGLMRAYFLPLSAMKNLTDPYLQLKGGVDGAAIADEQLIAVVDGVRASHYVLRPGLINWKIPLQEFLQASHQQSHLTVEFLLTSRNNSALRFRRVGFLVDKILLAGFIKPNEKIDLYDMQQYCQQQKDEMVCQINVPASVQLMELPIYYYPGLLSVTLNGKSVSYRGVLYYNHLVTGITPVPGQVNTVRFKFVGLGWANRVSLLAWCVFLIYGCYLLAQRRNPPHSPFFKGG